MFTRNRVSDKQMLNLNFKVKMKENKFRILLKACKDASLGVGKFTTILTLGAFSTAVVIALFEDIRWGGK